MMRAGILVSALFLSAIGLSVASESNAAIRYSIDIPAQGLGPALQKLAREHNFQLVYRPEYVRGVRTQGVVGELTPEEALNRLLEGTGLTHRRVDERTVTIVPVSGTRAAPLSMSSNEGDAQGRIRLAQATQPQGDTPTASASKTAIQVEEIIVTAQRREERLQDVPIAVVALSPEALQAKGVTSTEGLSAAVPGLTFTRVGASGTPFIRGVGSSAGDPSSEPSVATYVDGVYIASPNVNLFEFNAIERLEVLKGPQGTLFGRNATGGVIQVRTKDPSFAPEADLSVGYANYDTKSAAGYVTAGLSDAIAFNLAGSIRDQDDGYGNNRLSGVDTYVRDEQNIRGKLLFRLSDETQVMLAGDYLKVDSTGEDYKLPNGAIGRDDSVTDLGRYDTQNGFLAKTDTKSRGGSLTVDHDWGSIRFKSITAYRKATGVNAADVDLVPDPYFNVYSRLTQDNWSQEFHLASSGDARVTWLVGAFYYDSSAGYSPLQISGTDLGGLTLDIYGDVRTKSASVFAQATTEIAPRTNLTLGLRYTDEKQEYTAKTDSDVGLIAPEDSVDQSFNDPTWRIALDYKFTPDILGYVSYNRGIKSGGYGALSPVDTAAFDPEQLDAYEVGVKSELLDRRLRLNASAFWYDYKDIQVQIVQGSSTFTQNAASARIRGIDLELQAALGERFTVSGNLAYTDGEYRDYENAGSYGLGVGPLLTIDASGNDTVRTPDLSGSLTLDYRMPISTGTLLSSLTVAQNGKFYWAADNERKEDAYTLVNASVRWLSSEEKYSVTVWGKNLTDEEYRSMLSESSYGDLTRQGDPRTYGVTLGVSF